MTFAETMEAGRAAMARRQWSTAYSHFHAAHDLGHARRAQHLAAHRAALQAAVRGRAPGRLLYQGVFLVVASLTSWR